MSEKQFILCQDDLGNYEIRYDDKVFHFLWEVAPILNKQQSTISKLEEEKGYWKSKAMTLLMQVRRLTPRMTAKEVIEFGKELEDE